jgi:hypothetical protein
MGFHGCDHARLGSRRVGYGIVVASDSQLDLIIELQQKSKAFRALLSLVGAILVVV